jgi:hypothetical protein
LEVTLIRKALVFSSCVVLTIGWLWAVDFWEKKPYTEWSEKETEKMLTDSPWGDRMFIGDTMVSGGSPGGMTGGGGGRGRGRGGGATVSGEDLARSQNVNVRLHSAVPIRMALAQRAILAGTLPQEDAEESIKTHPAPGYLILGVTLPGGWSRGPLGDEEIESLKEKIYIELKKSKKRIRFERLVPPNRGQSRETYLYFPRTEEGRELFLPEEEEAKFRANLNSRTKVGVNFKFKKMMFDGKLEL